jgi:hypothetical protein
MCGIAYMRAKQNIHPFNIKDYPEQEKTILYYRFSEANFIYNTFGLSKENRYYALPVYFLFN